MLSAVAVLAVGALSLGPLTQCGGGTRADCYDAQVAYTANGYGVRELDCVRGPGTMVASWDCVRSGVVVSRPPTVRKSWQTSATFAVTCWNATPRLVSLYP